MSKLKELLSQKILSIPGVTQETFKGKDGGEFTSFSYRNKDFAHFHPGNELDLRLTKKVIAKEKIVHPKDSIVHPNRAQGSPWIELRFNTQTELLNVYRLVELAIKQI